MDELLVTLLELAMFFILLIFNLQLFNAVNFEKLFRKGHIKQIQMLYFFSVIIFTYLLTKALMNIIILSTQLTP